MTSMLPSLKSCSQKPSTLLTSTVPSVVMSVTSSFTQNACCCSAMIPHGRKNLQMISDITMGSFDVWIGRLLPAIPPYWKVWPKHRSLPRRWPSGLQQNTATNWKDQKGNVQNFPWPYHGLKITIEANKTIVNFLDITLDLQSGKHYPFTKEGNVPLYVHKNPTIPHPS